MLMSAAFLVSTVVQFALALIVAWLIGPTEFGRYALAIAAMSLAQSLAMEWARLGTTRFLSAGNDAALVARFGRALAAIGLAALAIGALLATVGGANRWLFALVAPSAWLMGYAEFRAARLRALDRRAAYARFVLVRNLASALAMPAAAWFAGTAEAVMLAFVGAVIPALLLDRPGPAEAAGAASDPVPDRATLLAYAGPGVATNLVYHALFLALRAIVAWQAGLAASGQFSLALDFALRIVMTLGSALDVWLFQLAVSESRRGDVAATRKRLEANAAIVLAVLAPALAGLWLTLPSLEALLVSPAFRAGFSSYLAAVLPGLMIYGAIQYALHPFVQIEGRTAPLAVAALAALATALALLAGAASLARLGPMAIGVAMSGGFAAGAAIILARIGRPVAEPLGLAARLLAALATLAAASYWLRGLEPGLLPLAGAVTMGGAAYLAAAWFGDLAGIASLIRATRRRAP